MLIDETSTIPCSACRSLCALSFLVSVHSLVCTMASKPKSFVWQHFDKVEGSGCKCIHCEAVLKHAAGCTSTMAKHLWARHSITDPAKLSGELKVKEELV